MPIAALNSTTTIQLSEIANSFPAPEAFIPGLSEQYFNGPNADEPGPSSVDLGGGSADVKYYAVNGIDYGQFSDTFLFPDGSLFMQYVDGKLTAAFGQAISGTSDYDLGGGQAIAALTNSAVALDLNVTTDTISYPPYVVDGGSEELVAIVIRPFNDLATIYFGIRETALDPMHYFIATIGGGVGTLYSAFDRAGDTVLAQAMVRTLTGYSMLVSDSGVLRLATFDPQPYPAGPTGVVANIGFDDPAIQAILTSGGFEFVSSDDHFYGVSWLDNVAVKVNADWSSFDIINLTYDAATQAVYDGFILGDYGLYIGYSESSDLLLMTGGFPDGSFFLAGLGSIASSTYRNQISIGPIVPLACFNPCVPYAMKR